MQLITIELYHPIRQATIGHKEKHHLICIGAARNMNLSYYEFPENIDQYLTFWFTDKLSNELDDNVYKFMKQVANVRH